MVLYWFEVRHTSPRKENESRILDQEPVLDALTPFYSVMMMTSATRSLSMINAVIAENTSITSVFHIKISVHVKRCVSIWTCYVAMFVLRGGIATSAE